MTQRTVEEEFIALADDLEERLWVPDGESTMYSRGWLAAVHQIRCIAALLGEVSPDAD